MSDRDEPGGEGEPADGERVEDSPSPGFVATVLEQLRPALLSVPLLTLLTGVAFPVVVVILAWPLFPNQAGGSLLVRDGVVGSELIGQEFTGPGYFHARPSAAGRGYDASASGGTNLGSANRKLRDGALDELATRDADESFVGVGELADGYRARNGLAPRAVVPVDAVTRSASGLDPHISPANAALQVSRVARARGLGEAEVLRLVAEATHGRQFGLLGAPRVAVLPLNLALDRVAPRAPALAR